MSEKIKLFTYKADGNTPALKNADAEKLDGTNIFYSFNAETESFAYFYDLAEGEKICNYLTQSTATPPAEILEWWKQNNEKCTKDYYFYLLDEKIKRGAWTGNLDKLICETFCNYALAKKVEENRQICIEKRNRERQLEEEEKAKKLLREQAEEEQKRLAKLARADENLRAGQFIEAGDFEALCGKYGVKLTPKFVGWLRNSCGKIKICHHENNDYNWAWKYATTYYAKKNHTSISISKIADELATAMEI